MMPVLFVVAAIAQAPAPAPQKTIEVNLPFLKVGSVNSNSNLFTEECCSKLLKTFERKDIYKVTSSGEKYAEQMIGQVVCLHREGDWLYGKCVFSSPPPKGFVLRLHSSPLKYTVSDELNYTISQIRVIRFLLVDELKGSRWD